MENTSIGNLKKNCDIFLNTILSFRSFLVNFLSPNKSITYSDKFIFKKMTLSRYILYQYADI